MSKPSGFLLSVFVLSACGRIGIDETDTTLTQPIQTRCELLEGRRFSTLEVQTDCGPAPAGSQLSCRWSVSFASQDEHASSFSSHYSDIGDGGVVTCLGNAIVDEYGRARGSHDPNTDVLVWDEIEYTVQ
jgi:hypothetical protein